MGQSNNGSKPNRTVALALTPCALDFIQQYDSSEFAAFRRQNCHIELWQVAPCDQQERNNILSRSNAIQPAATGCKHWEAARDWMAHQQQKWPGKFYSHVQLSPEAGLGCHPFHVTLVVRSANTQTPRCSRRSRAASRTLKSLSSCGSPTGTRINPAPCNSKLMWSAQISRSCKPRSNNACHMEASTSLTVVHLGTTSLHCSTKDGA